MWTQFIGHLKNIMKKYQREIFFYMFVNRIQHNLSTQYNNVFLLFIEKQYQY